MPGLQERPPKCLGRTIRMRMGLSTFLLLGMLLLFPLAGCGGEGGETAEDPPGPAASASATDAGGLSEEELVKGIGPITDMELGEIDPARVDRGDEIFTLKCAACHKLDERYIGPPLRDVLDRRAPEFVMNMMLNSWEMTQRHPTVREMLAEYYTPMPNQGLSEEDARAILDYLRNAAREGQSH